MNNFRWITKISPFKAFAVAVFLNLLIFALAIGISYWIGYNRATTIIGPGFGQLLTLLFLIAVLIGLFAILLSLFKREVSQAFFMFLAALIMSVLSLAFIGPALFGGEGVHLQAYTYYLMPNVYIDQFFGTEPPYPDPYKLLQCDSFSLLCIKVDEFSVPHSPNARLSQDGYALYLLTEGHKVLYTYKP